MQNLSLAHVKLSAAQQGVAALRQLEFAPLRVVVGECDKLSSLNLSEHLNDLHRWNELILLLYSSYFMEVVKYYTLAMHFDGGFSLSHSEGSTGSKKGLEMAENIVLAIWT